MSEPNQQPDTAFTINDFSTVEELETVLELSSQPLPSRPDGVIVCVKYTSLTQTSTESTYTRLSRSHPDTLFLRCYREYEGSKATFGAMDVPVVPTYDVYSRGIRVGRVVGEEVDEVEGWIQRYGYVVSKTDLFSEDADAGELKWGKRGEGGTTPRTTAAFVPGYDWDKKGGFFDEKAGKMEEEFMDTFGDWTPDVEDD